MSNGIGITARSVVTCLGRGRAAHAAALADARSGLTPCDYGDLPFACHIGRVAGIEGDIFPKAQSAFDNRASRLAVAALKVDGLEGDIARARARWGPRRVGIVLGTSTSGVERLEAAYRSRPSGTPLPAAYSVRHNNDHQAVTAFLAAHLGLDGPAYTISTACSSSAKALVDAVQLITSGICDAVLAGGVDSLCLTSLNGFEALQLVSRAPCRPCDVARDGLSIGEAAAFLLVERSDAPFRLAGAGESSDGISMSTPPVDGAGAAAAMRSALAAAGIGPEAIGHVNLHGTATPTNDRAECTAVAAVFGPATCAASLKGAIGHTLGAAGAAEAVISLIALEEGIVPGTAGLATLDPEIVCAISPTPRRALQTHVMSNSFGFGGSNCALVLARA